MQRHVDLTLLRTFVAVADLGQITKAAHRVNVSQSAVSQQINRLESMLGVNLLNRDSKQLRLSDAGEKLYQHAVTMLSLNDEVLRSMSQAAHYDGIRLGVPHDLVESLMPAVLKSYKQTCPNTVVEIFSESTFSLLNQLQRREIDMTLTTELVGTGRGAVLFEDQLVWTGSSITDFDEDGTLVVALGDRTDCFRDVAVAALERSGLSWRQIRQPGGLGSVYALLAAGVAISPLLSKCIPSFLTPLSCSSLPNLPNFEVGLVHKDGKLTDEEYALLDTLTTVLET
ncbi:MAG: LysR family transcriptional regulator [Paracoccaceae bacterium]